MLGRIGWQNKFARCKLRNKEDCGQKLCGFDGSFAVNALS